MFWIRSIFFFIFLSHQQKIHTDAKAANIRQVSATASTGSTLTGSQSGPVNMPGTGTGSFENSGTGSTSGTSGTDPTAFMQYLTSINQQLATMFTNLGSTGMGMNPASDNFGNFSSSGFGSGGISGSTNSFGPNTFSSSEFGSTSWSNKFGSSSFGNNAGFSQASGANVGDLSSGFVSSSGLNSGNWSGHFKTNSNSGTSWTASSSPRRIARATATSKGASFRPTSTATSHNIDGFLSIKYPMQYGVLQRARAIRNCLNHLANAMAAKMLLDPRITLATVHADNHTDDATAYKSFLNWTLMLITRKLPQRSSYACPKRCPMPAPGLYGCPSLNILKYVDKLAKNGHITINDFTGGCHDCNSPHYAGDAVDLKKDLIRAREFGMECQKMGGWFFDEGESFHCEIRAKQPYAAWNQYDRD